MSASLHFADILVGGFTMSSPKIAIHQKTVYECQNDKTRVGKYPKKIIEEAIQQVEKGEDRKLICARFGMSKGTAATSQALRSLDNL